MKTPRTKFWFIPKKRVGFSLEAALETAPMQIGGVEQARNQSKWIGSPQEAREEWEGRAGHENPVTSFLVGSKTRPMTRSTRKQGPSIQTLAST